VSFSIFCRGRTASRACLVAARRSFQDYDMHLTCARAGFEPAAYCLGGTSGPSPDGAGRGLMWCLAAPMVAGCGPAWPHACRRWLPDWLPGISLAPLTFERSNAVSSPLVVKSHIRGSAPMPRTSMSLITFRNAEPSGRTRAEPPFGAEIGSMVLEVLAVQIQAFCILRVGLDPLRMWVPGTARGSRQRSR
jgi:hypothetical protein